MSEFNYDTYCGLYCGACSIIKAFQNGIKDPFARMFSQELGMELQCHGCKSDHLFENCARCTIRPCAREKGVEHCMDCPDYPCQTFRSMQFLVEKLPHWNTAAINSETIKNQGVQRWLEEQESQWKCPDCQTGYTWYATDCSSCGRDLGSLKPYKNAFDSSIFKMMAMPDPEEIFKKEVVYKQAGVEQVGIQNDIVYRGQEEGGLLFDLYYPANHRTEKRLPAVILVHGDAPVANLKDYGQYTSLGRILAASGLIGVAFNHRMLMQGAGIKDVINDIEDLIKYLIEHSDQYGIDKSRMTIWSLSAGVPFGLYAGMHKHPACIKCQVAYYGFGDFSSLCKLFAGSVDFQGLEVQAEEYSPLGLLNQDPDLIAPLLIARAGQDQIPMLLDSLDNFIGAALANNLHVEIYNHPEGKHAFDLYNDDPRTREIIEKTLEFLKRHLGEH